MRGAVCGGAFAHATTQALAREAKRKQEEEKSRLEEMKRQEKKALEEADAARFKGKEAKEPKTLTQFQILEQKTKREAQARAMARQEVHLCPSGHEILCGARLMFEAGPQRQVHGNVGRAGALLFRLHSSSLSEVR